MADRLDLDGYFRRIGWTGPTRVDHATLGGLLAAHVLHIPFENLDVLLGRGIRLEPAAVYAKLVTARRGGYCFEHATLFATVLEQLGFTLLRHTARVVLFVPREQSPRTHEFISVTLPEGRFVVDPGFGSLAPRLPVPLAAEAEVRFGEDAHWMARDGDLWILRARTAGRVQDCWVSTLEPDHAVDFELGNHFTSTHPSSAFVNRIMLRAFTPDGRIGVMNREVTRWTGSAGVTTTLPDRAALRALLAQDFGLELPEILGLRVPSIAEWS